ncbi:pleckstrin homology domain-containing family A member 3-like [Pelodytes ibericus]
MEGFLHKWTNYLSGWQPRYFVLDRGILSYYDSQEDVGKASKGSIKMAVCEIQVHHSDSCRMDLIIPREQCYCLRAESVADRQRWLVALGSAKACLGDSASQKTKEKPSNKESLGQKLSEMRLFCDLLMQQVVEIQGTVNPGATPDTEKLNAACRVLHGTCTYISSTLDDCIKYVNTNQHPPSQAPTLPTVPEDVVGTKLPQARKVKRAISQSAVQKPPRAPHSTQQGDGATVLRNLEEMAVRSHSWDKPHPPLNNRISSKDDPAPANHTAEHSHTTEDLTVLRRPFFRRQEISPAATYTFNVDPQYSPVLKLCHLVFMIYRPGQMIQKATRVTSVQLVLSAKQSPCDVNAVLLKQLIIAEIQYETFVQLNSEVLQTLSTELSRRDVVEEP